MQAASPVLVLRLQLSSLSLDVPTTLSGVDARLGSFLWSWSLRLGTEHVDA